MSSTALPRSASLTRIPSLDGLRALSIFLVMALHTIQRYSVSHHVSLVWYAIFNGETGVFIFFEISGFLITSLLLQEHEKRGSISLRGFYLRRAFRILPPLYLYIGVIVLLGLAGRILLTRIDIVSALFFFHNIKASDVMWSLEHLWSISAEEQFYLVWPFILVYCLRRPGHAGRVAASVIPCMHYPDLACPQGVAVTLGKPGRSTTLPSASSNSTSSCSAAWSRSSSTPHASSASTSLRSGDGGSLPRSSPSAAH